MGNTTVWCDVTDMTNWSDHEICDYYDQNPDLSNRQYAAQLGISCSELNEILMDRG